MFRFLFTALYFTRTDAFFPKLFQIENSVKSLSKQLYNEENKLSLDKLCEELMTYSPRGTMYVQDLHGPWRVLSESNVKHEYIYQVLDYNNKVVTETCKFMNGTLVETTSPFLTENRWDESKVYLSYSTEISKDADGKAYFRYKTCKDKSFQLIYASPSIRVEQLIYSGDIRVYEPTQIVQLNNDEPCSEN